MQLVRHNQRGSVPAVPDARHAAEVMLEVGHLAQFGMFAYGMLDQAAKAMAGNDPILLDDLRAYAKFAQACHGMIIQSFVERS